MKRCTADFYSPVTAPGGRKPGACGTITFGPDITKDPPIIVVLHNTDLCTFIHESGHFSLEVLNHAAQQAGAPAAIVRDVDMLLQWFEAPDQTLQTRTAAKLQRGHGEFVVERTRLLQDGNMPKGFHQDASRGSGPANGPY